MLKQIESSPRRDKMKQNVCSNIVNLIYMNLSDFRTMGGPKSGHRGHRGGRGGKGNPGGSRPSKGAGKSANIIADEIATAYKEGKTIHHGQWVGEQTERRKKSDWVLEADDLKITVSGSADTIYAKTGRLRDPNKTKFISIVGLAIRVAGKPPVFRDLAYKGVKGEHNRDKVDKARAVMAKKVELVFGIPADQFSFKF